MQPLFLGFVSSKASNSGIALLIFVGGLTKNKNALRHSSCRSPLQRNAHRLTGLPKGGESASMSPTCLVCLKSSSKFNSFTLRRSMYIPAMPKFGLLLSLLLFSFSRELGWPPCAGVASTPRAASDWVTHEIPAGKIATLDSTHAYSLAELVDIAEHNNPRTRVA